MKTSKKIVLIGNFGVGKSSIIRRFVENTFSENYKVTIGVHIFKKEIIVPDGNTISLIIWDLEGTDDINLTRESYLIGTSAFIYVFDVTRPATYSEIDMALEFLNERYPQAPVKVVGNKIDLVSKEFLTQNEDTFGKHVSSYTSAKTGDQIEDLFFSLAHGINQSNN